MAKIENNRTEFLKERFIYCKEIYYNQVERREKIENKTKLLFSFVILLLSAMIFNIPKIIELKIFVSAFKSVYLVYSIQTISIITILFYFISIVCIFISIKIQSFDEIFPQNFSEKFLFRGSEYFLDEEEKIVHLEDNKMLEHFFYTMTKVIIHTIEFNLNLLNNKAKWFDYSWQSLLFSMVLLCFNLFIIILFGGIK